LHDGIDLCSSDQLVESQSVPDAVLEQLAAVSLSDTSENMAGNTSIDQSDMTSSAEQKEIIDHTTAVGAVISGIKMDPESVKNFSWTEDRQTFACKLKIELVDQHNRSLHCTT